MVGKKSKQPTAQLRKYRREHGLDEWAPVGPRGKKPRRFGEDQLTARELGKRLGLSVRGFLLRIKIYGDTPIAYESVEQARQRQLSERAWPGRDKYNQEGRGKGGGNEAWQALSDK